MYLIIHFNRYIKVFKYLGVTITNKLKWDKHLEKTRSAIIKKIHHARAAFEDKGLNTYAGKWIQSSIILPKATYGAVAWASHDLTQKEVNILRRINGIGLNVITNTKKSTPTRKLEIIMNTKPLHLLAQSQAIKTWARIRSTNAPDWDGITYHTKSRPLAHKAWLEEKLTEISGGGDLIEKANERSNTFQTDQELKNRYPVEILKDGIQMPPEKTTTQALVSLL